MRFITRARERLLENTLRLSSFLVDVRSLVS